MDDNKRNAHAVPVVGEQSGSNSAIARGEEECVWVFCDCVSLNLSPHLTRYGHVHASLHVQRLWVLEREGTIGGVSRDVVGGTKREGGREGEKEEESACAVVGTGVKMECPTGLWQIEYVDIDKRMRYAISTPAGLFFHKAFTSKLRF